MSVYYVQSRFLRKKCLTDPKKSIYLFAMIFVVYSIIYMTKNCFSSALAAIVDAGIYSKSQIGLITAVYSLIYAPFQVVGGIVADRHSPSVLILIGIIGAAIANLLIYFIDGYVSMLIIWALNAVVQFAAWPAIFRIVSTQLAKEHRLNGVFYIGLASCLGLAMSYLCAALITDWKNNFLVSAVALFIAAAVFMLSYNRIEKHMEIDVDDVKPSNAGHVNEQKGFFKIMLKAGVPVLLFVSAAATMLSIGVRSLAPVMLMESYEALSPQVASALNILLVASTPIGIFIVKSKFLQKFNTVGIISFFFAISLPFVFVITFVGKANLLVVVAALAFVMVFIGAGETLFNRISLSFNKYGKAGTMSGLVNCCAGLSGIITNYVFAKMAEIKGWGFTTNCWLYIAIISFLLAVIIIPVWKKFERE